MKKTLVLVLALVMVLALAACGVSTENAAPAAAPVPAVPASLPPPPRQGRLCRGSCRGPFASFVPWAAALPPSFLKHPSRRGPPRQGFLPLLCLIIFDYF